MDVQIREQPPDFNSPRPEASINLPGKLFQALLLQKQLNIQVCKLKFGNPSKRGSEFKSLSTSLTIFLSISLTSAQIKTLVTTCLQFQQIILVVPNKAGEQSIPLNLVPMRKMRPKGMKRLAQIPCSKPGGSWWIHSTDAVQFPAKHLQPANSVSRVPSLIKIIFCIYFHPCPYSTVSSAEIHQGFLTAEGAAEPIVTFSRL